MIDQTGAPVPNAEVDYGTIDKLFDDGSDYRGKSDGDGNFRLSGIKGAVLTVGVAKEGYYPIHGKSNGSFAYGTGPDSTRRAPPSKETPALFVLQKAGMTEPLVHLGSRQINIPKTGQILGIDLATGETGQGNLQVASWIGGSAQRNFDWRYQLSVPGGGLIERKGQFDFEAPGEGYEQTIEVGMAADAERWNSRTTKEYFAKLGDGRYARFSIRFYAGDRNFVVLESYMNPIPGRRNLEFEAAKVVQSP